MGEGQIEAGIKSEVRDLNSWRQTQSWRQRGGQDKDEDGDIDRWKCRENCIWKGNNESWPKTLCFVIQCGSLLGVLIENASYPENRNKWLQKKFVLPSKQNSFSEPDDNIKGIGFPNDN